MGTKRKASEVAGDELFDAVAPLVPSLSPSSSQSFAAGGLLFLASASLRAAPGSPGGVVASASIPGGPRSIRGAPASAAAAATSAAAAAAAPPPLPAGALSLDSVLGYVAAVGYTVEANAVLGVSRGFWRSSDPLLWRALVDFQHSGTRWRLRTRLMYAASANNCPRIAELLALGADLKVRDGFGFTALLHAAIEGHVEALRQLLAAGAELEGRTTNGMSPLLLACYFGRMGALEFLADSGADIDARDAGNWTGVIWAANNGDLDAVTFLCERGANVNAVTTSGRTAIGAAISHGPEFAPIVAKLLAHGATIDAAPREP